MSTALAPDVIDELTELLQQRQLASTHLATCLFDDALRAYVVEDGAAGPTETSVAAHGPDRLTADELAAAAKEAARQARAADEALGRIARLEYGICEGCAGPIPLDRLRAEPEATRCHACGP